MAIASMTGFARVDGQEGGWRWHWEARAVNGKALEVRLRLPNGFEALETELRERVARHVRRGSVQVTLQLKDELRSGAVRVNQAVLAELLRIGRELAATLGSPPPTVEGVLALPGVVELGEAERNEAELSARNAAILASAEAARGHALLMLGHLDEALSVLIETISLAEAAGEHDSLASALTITATPSIQAICAGSDAERRNWVERIVAATLAWISTPAILWPWSLVGVQ